MGISSRITAKSHVAVCEGVPAAVAVLSGAGSIERATRGFLDRIDIRDGSLASCSKEVEFITTGRADQTTVPLDGLEAELVAVVNGEGRRMAVLALPAAPDAGTDDQASPVFEEPLDESPAIIWLKDLDGRYLRVNRRYVEQLGTDAKRVCGHTDAELTAAGSIEGLRLEDETINAQGPLELEYLIGAFEERPAFAALRFALRDGRGEPTATCSVAAPITEASLARAECDRLMKIDRWGRLDACALRRELLDEWDLTPVDVGSGPPLDRDDRVAAALVERDEALAAVGSLQEELSRERDQQDGLRAESERSARRAHELDGAVAAAEQRSHQLEQSLASSKASMGDLQVELTAVRDELDEHLRSRERLEAAASVPATGLRWGARAQRTLSAALMEPNEWRSVLDRAVGALGSEGRWDAVIAWCSEKGHGSMRCAAFWKPDPARLNAFEAGTWKHMEDVASAEFGRARNRMAATCVLDLQSAEDPLLKAAGKEGIGSALLVPISDGSETIAMLVLLSGTATAPSPELMVALEAVALQLGTVARLLTLTDAPRWRMARV